MDLGGGGRIFPLSLFLAQFKQVSRTYNLRAARLERVHMLKQLHANSLFSLNSARNGSPSRSGSPFDRGRGYPIRMREGGAAVSTKLSARRTNSSLFSAPPG